MIDGCQCFKEGAGVNRWSTGDFYVNEIILYDNGGYMTCSRMLKPMGCTTQRVNPNVN